MYQPTYLIRIETATATFIARKGQNPSFPALPKQTQEVIDNNPGCKVEDMTIELSDWKAMQESGEVTKVAGGVFKVVTPAVEVVEEAPAVEVVEEAAPAIEENPIQKAIKMAAEMGITLKVWKNYGLTRLYAGKGKYKNNYGYIDLNNNEVECKLPGMTGQTARNELREILEACF